MKKLTTRAGVRGRGFIWLFGFLLATVACDNLAEDPAGTVADYLAEREIDPANRQFKLFRFALERTGLLDALERGRFTVFAPTDAAMQQAGWPDSAALMAAPLDSLADWLRYHLVAAELETTVLPPTRLDTPLVLPTRRDTATLPALDTAQASIRVLFGALYLSKPSATGLFVNGARVIQPDRVATNGIVHHLDRALAGPQGNLRQKVVSAPQLQVFAAALQRAGRKLQNRLAGQGPLTVFAPTDQAFAAAGITLANINTIAPDSLARQLEYHILKARRFSHHFPSGKSYFTLEGTPLQVEGPVTELRLRDRGPGLSPARLVEADVLASNGVLHLIDQVLQYQ